MQPKLFCAAWFMYIYVEVDGLGVPQHQPHTFKKSILINKTFEGAWSIFCIDNFYYIQYDLSLNLRCRDIVRF